MKHLSVDELLSQAEASFNPLLWETIARRLLAERDAAKPKAKAAPVKPRAGDADAYLTLTERRALGLPPAKDGKIGGGCYRYVLVEFANGLRLLTGQYPRAKNPDDLTQAIISARARYLGALSGGRLLNAAKARHVPRVKAARVVEDRTEIERARVTCGDMLDALAAFATA